MSLLFYNCNDLIITKNIQVKNVIYFLCLFLLLFNFFCQFRSKFFCEYQPSYLLFSSRLLQLNKRAYVSTQSKNKKKEENKLVRAKYSGVPEKQKQRTSEAPPFF